MTSAEQTLLTLSRDLPSFILDTGFFKTKDEHRSDGKFAIPDFEYCRVVLTTVATERLIVIPKSRQVLITWLMACYAVAAALTRKNQLIIYQTKREEDALSFMGRVYFLYDHLPAWLRTIRPRLLPPKENKYKLELPAQHSKIWGIPSGADIIRSNTVSIFISDETNFQPEAKASLRAAGPSLGQTGQGIWISSANLGGVMEQLVAGKW